MTVDDRLMRFPVFGSTAVVAVAEPRALDAAAAAVIVTAAAFDAACSRFRDDSELSAVNAGAGAPVAVGPVLLEAVQASLRAARLTDGDVDPTVGQAADRARLRPRLRRGERLADPVGVRSSRYRAGVPSSVDADARDRPGAPRRVARPRRDRQGAGRRPRGRRGAPGRRLRGARVVRRRHLDRRSAAARRLAGARHRRPPLGRRRARASGSRCARAGWPPRARPPAAGRTTTASPTT